MERLRYPATFKTRREYLWYIRGLMDAKQSMMREADMGIARYRNSLQFTDFPENDKKQR